MILSKKQEASLQSNIKSTPFAIMRFNLLLNYENINNKKCPNLQLIQQSLHPRKQEAC
jgi:hypothetical protein